MSRGGGDEPPAARSDTAQEISRKDFSKKFEKPLDKTTNLWYNKDVNREEPSKDAIWTVRALKDTAHGSIKKIKIFPKPY